MTRKGTVSGINGWFSYTADLDTGDVWFYSDGGDIMMDCETLRSVVNELERKGMYDG